MPKAWTGAPPEADLQRRFTIGEEIEASVVEIADGGRRIRVAKKGVPVKADDGKEAAGSKKRGDQAERVAEEPPSTFGTSLGDKLRAALGRKETGS